MFGIGHFAQVAQVSVRTLRHYGDVGLLPPAVTDPTTGTARTWLLPPAVTDPTTGTARTWLLPPAVTDPTTGSARTWLLPPAVTDPTTGTARTRLLSYRSSIASWSSSCGSCFSRPNV